MLIEGKLICKRCDFVFYRPFTWAAISLLLTYEVKTPMSDCEIVDIHSVLHASGTFLTTPSTTISDALATLHSVSIRSHRTASLVTSNIWSNVALDLLCTCARHVEPILWDRWSLPSLWGTSWKQWSLLLKHCYLVARGPLTDLTLTMARAMTCWKKFLWKLISSLTTFRAFISKVSLDSCPTEA